MSCGHPQILVDFFDTFQFDLFLKWEHSSAGNTRYFPGCFECHHESSGFEARLPTSSRACFG